MNELRGIEVIVKDSIAGRHFDAAIADDPTPGRKKRHKRPKIAADDTLPIFEDEEPLIWCPATCDWPSGHYAPRSKFGRNKSRVSKLSAYCRSCRAKQEKKYRLRANKRSVVKEMRRIAKRIEKAVDRVMRVLGK